MNIFSKFLYVNLCDLYSTFVALFENFFLKKSSPQNINFEKIGYLKIDDSLKLNILRNKFDFILTQKERDSFGGKYQKITPLSEGHLKKIIRKIFDKQFRDFLTSQTGFKYTIDYFGAYQNFHIPVEFRDRAWYANHYHLDKPFSKNMLKVFIPLAQIGINDGPLELFDISSTKKILQNKEFIQFSDKHFLVGNLGEFFVCKLNLCLHRAGVPEKGHSTNLIMMQLNPSNEWSINSLIFERQFKMEPKFTSLMNVMMLRRTIKI